MSSASPFDGVQPREEASLSLVRNGLCKEIDDLDNRFITEYNKRRQKDGHPHFIHYDLGPCPFEGDLRSAPVLLLLANPCSNDVCRDDHCPNDALLESWPLWALGANANIKLKKWWGNRLRELINRFGARAVSRSIAAIQLFPWASSKFDPTVSNPSRELMLQTVERQLIRRPLLVVMRSRKLWHKSAAIAEYENQIQNGNPLCSYVSSGNLGTVHFEAVVAAIAKHLTKTRFA